MDTDFTFLTGVSTGTSSSCGAGVRVGAEVEEDPCATLPVPSSDGFLYFGTFLNLAGFPTCLGVKIGLAMVIFTSCLLGTGIVVGSLEVTAEAFALTEFGGVTIAVFRKGILNSLVPFLSGGEVVDTLFVEDAVGSTWVGVAFGSEAAMEVTGEVVSGLLVANTGGGGGTEMTVGVVGVAALG